jgi:hypothetical protein
MRPDAEDPRNEPELPESGGDYSYDLVHEDLPDVGASSDTDARPSETTIDGTGHPETGGDYSYDLAHDLMRDDT